jgi:hypothetical protein
MPSKPFPSREDIDPILEQPQSKLANLKPRKYLLCDPDELVSLDAIDPDGLSVNKHQDIGLQPGGGSEAAT